MRISSLEVVFLETVKNVLLGALLALFAAALLCFPSEAAGAARGALALCFRSVLPSLFPFFVLSSLLVALGAADAFARVLRPVMRPLFGLSGAGALALALGLVGGYPVGARTTAELYRGGGLSKSEAETLLGFCNNAGPGFMLGVCGASALQNARAGAYLCLVHAAAALLAGPLLCRAPPAPARGCAPERVPPRPARVKRNVPRSRASAFTASVRDSFAAVWSVCGFIVIFAVILRFLTLLLPAGAENATWYPLPLGAVELTSGVLAVAPDRGGFVLCAALLGWGGASVQAGAISSEKRCKRRCPRRLHGWYRGCFTESALPLVVGDALRLGRAGVLRGERQHDQRDDIGQHVVNGAREV